MARRIADKHFMLKAPFIAVVLLFTLASCSGTPVVEAKGKPLAAADCQSLDFPSTGDMLDDMTQTQLITAATLDLFVDASEQDAVACATSMGLTSRIVQRDGEDYVVTMDYSPTRVNFNIRRGLVTAATSG